MLSGYESDITDGKACCLEGGWVVGGVGRGMASPRAEKFGMTNTSSHCRNVSLLQYPAQSHWIGLSTMMCLAHWCESLNFPSRIITENPTLCTVLRNCRTFGLLCVQ